LEKAYEDLEREILEIKMKLQGSSIGPAGPGMEQPQHMSQQAPNMPETNLAQSMGSTGLHQAQFHPAHSMTAQNPHRASTGIYNDSQ